MLARFKQNLLRFADALQRPLLVAVSGGIDSMVLVDLLRKSACDFAIAHVNFKLRGAESDDDEHFVRTAAATSGLRFYSTSYDTDAFAADHKLSIQQAARFLRYQWLEEVRKNENFSRIVTAHHADDHLETILINLSRGSGIDGLCGIPETSETVLRPLLPFSREEIKTYAFTNRIPYREDSSNQTDDYLRNRLRHHVIPAFKQCAPHLLNNVSKSSGYLRQSAAMARDAAGWASGRVVISLENKTLIKIPELLELSDFRGYLFHWLRDLGFTAWEDIWRLPFGSSGKKVFSGEYMIYRNREVLEVMRIPKETDTDFSVDRTGANASPVELLIEEVDAIGVVANHCIFVDADRLKFPLILRHRREADVFQPFGMNGKKSVSKFYKDEKLSLDDKNQTWLLCSENNIVWIVGLRADDRFKVTSDTTKILKISTS